MRFSLITLSLLALFGCSQPDKAVSTPPAPNTSDSNSASTSAADQRYGHPAIDKDVLMENIEILSSDDFGGRSPASAGEQKTIAFLKDQFMKLGLEPGNGQSYYQDVPLVTMTAEPTSDLLVTSDAGETFTLGFGEDAVFWSKRVTKASAIENSEMVFVGYGIVAPEYNWNDYAGVDVKGKTVVILVNDPGYATQDASLFNGNAMTYYGRWTYKYEEAAKQGAAGAIVIHETAPAAYPWSVVQGSWTGAQHDLVTPDKNMGRAAIEGWITDSMADRLFKAAGSSYEQAKMDALDRSVPSTSMNMKASAGITNSIGVSNSKNVLAKIEGSKRSHEYIVYMAHWDHLGTAEGIEEADKIYNGAVDNATGTAGLLAIAAAFQQHPTPERSILFVAVTAEESGLLGSKHYASNPPVPLNKTVAGINMDALNVYGATKNIAVVGYGSSELENYLREAAIRQNRTIGPEPTPEKGYFYRSDHFNLAKKGVPMLYAKGGADFVNGGTEAGEKAAKYYVTNDYHKPSDEINDRWDLTGAAEDLQLFFDIGTKIGNESSYPSWNDGNEFKAIRDASLAQ